MKRFGIFLAPALLLLGACGDSGDGDGNESTGDSPAAAQPTAELVGLKEACREAEAAARKMPDFTNEHEDYIALAEELEELANRGDAETKNALALMIEPARGYLPDDYGMFMDAERAFLEGIDGLQTRCAAVGSTAFQ